MAKKIRWGLYAIVLTLLSTLWMDRLGFYDPKYIYIDDFVLEKPLFFRNPYADIPVQLDANHTEVYFFYSNVIKSSATYTFYKDSNPDKFLYLTRYILDEKNITTTHCYIVNQDFVIDNMGVPLTVPSRKLHRYPYSISFVETSDERQQKMIDQICGDSPRVHAKARDR